MKVRLEKRRLIQWAPLQNLLFMLGLRISGLKSERNNHSMSAQSPVLRGFELFGTLFFRNFYSQQTMLFAKIIYFF